MGQDPLSGSGSLTRRTLRAVAWSSTGTAIQFSCSVAVMVVLARLLTPADFGLAAAGTLVISFLEVFTRLGVVQALVQRPEISRSHVETGFWYSIATGLLLAAAAWLSAPLVAGIMQMPGLVPVLRVLSGVLILRSATSVAEALLQRGMSFRTIANVKVVSYVAAYAPVGILLALQGGGVWALVGAHVAQVIVETVLLFGWGRHAMGFRASADALSELLSIGGGVTINKIANQVASQGDNFIVARLMGAEALGLYSRAYRLMSLPANLFGDGVEAVAFPAMAQAQEDRDRLRRAFRRSSALMASVVLPLSVLCVLTAPEIIDVALGDQWGGAVPAFQVLAAGIYFRLAYKTSGSLARATGHVYQLARLKIVYAVSVLILAWIGARWGIAGVAGGVLLALVGHFALLLRFSLRHLELPLTEFMLVYRPAVLTCSVAGAVTALTIGGMRDAGVGSFVVAGTATLVMAAATLLMLRLIPAGLLGADLLWWTAELGRLGRSRLPRFRRRARADAGLK